MVRNVDSAASMVALSATPDAENCRWRSEALNRPSKRTTLPRAGVDPESVTDRRKVVSASVTTDDYLTLSLEGKF